VKIYQGEREIAAYNKLLGTLRLDGIPPAPRGVPQIEVAFDIDANGILNVSAKDLGTGQERSAVIRDTGALTREEVERMVKEAEAHAEEDRRRREEIETRNEADSFAYQLNRMLKEYGDRLSPSDRSEIERGIEELRQAVKEGSIEEVRRKLEEVRQLSYRISEVLYREASQAAQQQAAGGDGQRTEEGGGSEGDVIDAEFRAEDES
jgi:molecular chaperone DnaK